MAVTTKSVRVSKVEEAEIPSLSFTDSLLQQSSLALLQLHHPFDDLLLIFRRYLREGCRHGQFQPISFGVIENLQQILLRTLRLAGDSGKRGEDGLSLAVVAVAGRAVLSISLRRLHRFSAARKRGGRSDDLRLERLGEIGAHLFFLLLQFIGEFRVSSVLMFGEEDQPN